MHRLGSRVNYLDKSIKVYSNLIKDGVRPSTSMQQTNLATEYKFCKKSLIYYYSKGEIKLFYCVKVSILLT